MRAALALARRTGGRRLPEYLRNAYLAGPGKQRDLDAAAGHGMAAIDLSESLDSTRGVGRLRGFYHQMTPHAKVPAVGDFLNRARGLVQV